MQPPELSQDSARILCASKKEAMDWSLVLISQAIGSSIRQNDNGEWWLSVAPEEVDKARHHIYLYQKENRFRRWQSEFVSTGLQYDTRIIFWGLLMAAFFALDELSGEALKAAGRMESSAVAQGEWWRLFTATTLHADLGHLAANLSIGLILMGLAVGLHGAGLALLGTLLGGVAGNLLSLALNWGANVGASGVINAALGMIVAYSIGARKSADGRQIMRRAFFGGLCFLMLFAMNPGTDVLAHVGGFAGGVMVGSGLMLTAKNLGQHQRANWLALIGYVALILLCWLSALRFMP